MSPTGQGPWNRAHRWGVSIEKDRGSRRTCVEKMPTLCHAEPCVSLLLFGKSTRSRVHKPLAPVQRLGRGGFPPRIDGAARANISVPSWNAQGLGRGDFSVRSDKGAESRQPGLPRLSRPVGICGLRESDTELSYDRAMGRKVCGGVVCAVAREMGGRGI